MTWSRKNSSRKHSIIGYLFVLCLGLVGSTATSLGPLLGRADALPYSYRLIGGVNGRYFWISPTTANHAYDNIIRAGVSSWNGLATSSSTVLFTELTSNAGTQADFYALDYGNTPWVGVTVMRDANGNGVVTAAGQPPYADWTYSEVSLNDYLLRQPNLFPSTNKIQNVAGHEMGHALGLDHTSNPNDLPLICALMWPNLASYEQCTPPVFTPQGDDRNSVRLLSP